MVVTDQIKILNRKIKQNEAQYDLDREAAKISALSSNNLGKYELLTGEDLNLKPSTVEQAKSEYSPLGKIFKKGLNKDEDKKEGLLKRLKNIEDKNEKLLEVKDKAKENIKEVTDFVDQPLSFEAKKLIEEIKVIQKDVDYRKLKIRGGNNVDYDFSDYKTFKELFRDLYYKQTTIDDVERKQDEITGVMGALKDYAQKDNKYVEAKNKLFNNVENFYKGREKIIEGFKTGVFPLYYNEGYEYQMKAQREIEEERRRKESKFFKYIENKSEDINYLLFKYYFNFMQPSELAKKLFEIKDQKKNNDFVEEIKNRWSKLKDKIEEISGDEKDNKGLNKILEIVKDILNFNKENQEGKALKILIPNQMLSRLPITLAQLKAGNNSEKLKNEIRQLLYSHYHSKNMTKQVYTNLINYI